MRLADGRRTVEYKRAVAVRLIVEHGMNGSLNQPVFRPGEELLQSTVTAGGICIVYQRPPQKWYFRDAVHRTVSIRKNNMSTPEKPQAISNPVL
jgi:hypothetical protein